jgi:hypothetical protein
MQAEYAQPSEKYGLVRGEKRLHIPKHHAIHLVSTRIVLQKISVKAKHTGKFS